MVITVRGKGDKERQTMLSGRLLCYLRAYWRFDRPKSECEWLFPGFTTAGHASPKTVGGVFRDVINDVGITKKVTPHSLRHNADFRIMPNRCFASVLRLDLSRLESA
jgi:site-specific recombinase XerD